MLILPLSPASVRQRLRKYADFWRRSLGFVRVARFRFFIFPHLSSKVTMPLPVTTVLLSLKLLMKYSTLTLSKNFFARHSAAWPSRLGRWISNQEVPGSNPPPYCYLDLFWVVPSSTPRRRCVGSFSKTRGKSILPQEPITHPHRDSNKYRFIYVPRNISTEKKHFS